jgi:hypothetical protein
MPGEKSLRRWLLVRPSPLPHLPVMRTSGAKGEVGWGVENVPCWNCAYTGREKPAKVVGVLLS